MATLEHDGESIAYRVLGEGPAVLLLHNLLLDGRAWDEVAAGLVAAGRRVVVVEARGHEASTARRAFGVDDLAGDALAALDAAGVASADVAGVSLGASVAVALAARAPGRVRRVALLAANPFAPSARDALETSGLALAVRAIRRRALETLFGPTFRRARPDVIAAWDARLARRPARDTWRAVRAWVRRPDATDALPLLRDRVLVASGAEDAAAPPRVAARVAAAIPGARAVAIEGAGHSVMVERPRAVLDLLLPFLA